MQEKKSSSTIKSSDSHKNRIMQTAEQSVSQTLLYVATGLGLFSFRASEGVKYKNAPDPLHPSSITAIMACVKEVLV